MLNDRRDVITDRRAHPRVRVESGDVSERRRGRKPRAHVRATKRIEFVVTDAELQALRAAAAENKQPMATLIRDAVNEFVADYSDRNPFPLSERARLQRAYEKAMDLNRKLMNELRLPPEAQDRLRLSSSY